MGRVSDGRSGVCKTLALTGIVGSIPTRPTNLGDNLDNVYVVTDTWVNRSGWPIAAPALIIVFLEKKDADDYVIENQKHHTFTDSTHQLSVQTVKFGGRNADRV